VTTPGDALSENVRAAAARLRGAAESGIPCPPVRDLIGPDDVDAAYAVQSLLNDERAAGSRVVGRKIGLTSAAVQRQLGVSQPDFGTLFEDMQYESGELIPYDRLLQPRIEAEVAFVLKSDLLDRELELDQVTDSVAYMVAALEVADSRVAGWDIRFGDTVADNASAGVYVLGAERVQVASIAPKDVTMTMQVTDQEPSRGTGADCLGDPLSALRWLALRALELGQPLRAGQLVLSGALGPMRAVTAGAEAVANITGLGTVSARFSGGP